MPNLNKILANRTWLRRSQPFPHIIARDVFKPEFYKALSSQLREILNCGLSETPAPNRFSRSIPGYDSYGIGIDHSLGGPIQVFISSEWRDMMSSLFNVVRTPYVFAGAHYHSIGSRNGFIHNDFNPVWFPKSSDEHIQIPNYNKCHYTTGNGSLQISEKIEVVRGAVVLFYLLNDGWRRGDGGETGLYANSSGEIGNPIARCSPTNNNLLAFECTPCSFHAYLTNNRLPRTSIIMWIHRTMEEAIQKFGDANLERWKT